MIMKQLAVFVENKTGKLCKATKIIAENKINLRALLIAETSDYGVLRIIVDNPLEAYEKLKAAGLTVVMNDMIVVKMGDHSGSLNEILVLLAPLDIGVEYLYAFLAVGQENTAYVALRIESGKEQQAIEALKAGGYIGTESIG